MWIILSIGALLIIALVILGYLRIKHADSKQRADLLSIFNNTEGALPSIEFGSSFGWPTFKVVFESKDDLELARKNGLITSLKNRIQSYYNADFDVERATHFTYKGHRYY